MASMRVRLQHTDARLARGKLPHGPEASQFGGKLPSAFPKILDLLTRLATCSLHVSVSQVCQKVIKFRTRSRGDADAPSTPTDDMPPRLCNKDWE